MSRLSRLSCKQSELELELSRSNEAFRGDVAQHNLYAAGVSLRSASCDAGVDVAWETARSLPTREPSLDKIIVELAGALVPGKPSGTIAGPHVVLIMMMMQQCVFTSCCAERTIRSGHHSLFDTH
jgi:hypothetical protein